MTSQTRKSFVHPSGATNGAHTDPQSDPLSSYFGLNYAQQAALLWANAAAVAAAASASSPSPCPQDGMSNSRTSKISNCSSSSGTTGFDLPSTGHHSPHSHQSKQSQRTNIPSMTHAEEKNSFASPTSHSSGSCMGTNRAPDPTTMMMASLYSSQSSDGRLKDTTFNSVHPDPLLFGQQLPNKKIDNKRPSDTESLPTSLSESLWANQLLHSLSGSQLSYQRQMKQQQQQATLLLAAALSREVGLGGFPPGYLEQLMAGNIDIPGSGGRSEASGTGTSSATTTPSLTAGAATNLAYAQAMMMAMAAAYGGMKTPSAQSGPSSIPTPSTPPSAAVNYDMMPLGPFGSSAVQTPTNLLPSVSTAGAGAVSSGEPAESFNEVLNFLTRCLNNPSGVTERPLNPQRSPIDHKLRSSPSSHPQRRNSRTSSNSRTRGSNGAASLGPASTGWEQPVTPVPTRHRGRGRPPKSAIASVHYPSHSKHATHSLPGATHLRASDETDVHQTHSCDPTTSSVGRRPSTAASAVDSSIEETIDEVLRHLAACDYDPTLVANRYATSTLGMALNRKRRKDNNTVTPRSINSPSGGLIDTCVYRHEPGEIFASSVSGNKRLRTGPSAESGLRLPLALGWHRETLVKGIGPGGILGEVVYVTPCGRRLWNLDSVRDYLKSNNVNMLSVDDFSFKSYVRLGDYYECSRTNQTTQSYVKMSESALEALTSAGVSDVDETKNNLSRCSWATSIQSDSKLDAHLNPSDPTTGAGRTSSTTLGTTQSGYPHLLPPAAHSHSVNTQQSTTFHFPPNVYDLSNSEVNFPNYLTTGLNGESLSLPPAAHTVNDCVTKTTLPFSLLDPFYAPPGLNPLISPMSLPTGAHGIASAVESPWSPLKRPMGLLSSSAFLAGTTSFTGLEPNLEREYMKSFFIQLAKEHIRLDREKRAHRLTALLEEREHQLTLRAKERMEHELKKPVDDLRLLNSKTLPDFDPIRGNRLSSQAFADCLLVIEFLHAFTEILCVDSETIPTLGMLQSGLVDRNSECQQAILHLLIELLKFAILDPGLPSSRLVTQLLGQRFSELEVNTTTVTGLLRVFLIGRNGYEDDMSDWLRPPGHFTELSGDQQATLLAFVCDELVGSSRLISTEVDRTIELQSVLKREKWVLESKIRRLRFLLVRKFGTGTSADSEGSAQVHCLTKTTKGHADVADSALEMPTTVDTHDEYSLSPGPSLDESGGGGSEFVGVQSYSGKRSHESSMKLQCDKPSMCGSEVPETQEAIEKHSGCSLRPIGSGSAAPNASATATAAVSAAAVASSILFGDEDDIDDVTQLEAKIDTLNQLVEYKQRAIDECSYRLSGIFLGQDRYYRRYYVLGHMGGIYIQGSASAIGALHCTEETELAVEKAETTAGIEDLRFGFDPDQLVAKIHERRRLAESRRYKINIPTSSGSTHLLHGSSDSVHPTPSGRKFSESATVPSTFMELENGNNEITRQTSLDCMLANNSHNEASLVSQETDIEEWSLHFSASTNLLSTCQPAINHAEEFGHSSTVFVVPTSGCSGSSSRESSRADAIAIHLGDLNTSVNDVDTREVQSIGSNTHPMKELFSGEVYECETISSLQTPENRNRFAESLDDLEHSYELQDEETHESSTCKVNDLSGPDRPFKPIDSNRSTNMNHPTQSTGDACSLSSFISEQDKARTSFDFDFDNYKSQPYSSAKLESGQSSANVDHISVPMKLEDNCKPTPGMMDQIARCSSAGKKYCDMIPTRDLEPKVTHLPYPDQSSSLDSEETKTEPVVISNEECSASSQPLDLSTRAGGGMNCPDTVKCLAASAASRTHESGYAFMESVGLDDVLLTTAALLFMTHNSIIPTSVACSETLSEPWKSVIAHYKSILIWALMEEEDETRSGNAPSLISKSTELKSVDPIDDPSSSILSLCEAVMILKKFFACDLVQGESKANTINKEGNDFVPYESDVNGVDPILDSEVEELAKRELLARRFQKSHLVDTGAVYSAEWSSLTSPKKLNDFIHALSPRGMRERNLARGIKRADEFVQPSLQTGANMLVEFESLPSDPDATVHEPRFLRVRSRRGKGRGSTANNTNFLSCTSTSSLCPMGMNRGEMVSQSTDCSPSALTSCNEAYQGGEQICDLGYSCTPVERDTTGYGEEATHALNSTTNTALTDSLVLEHRLRRRVTSSSVNRSDVSGSMLKSVVDRLEKRPGLPSFKALETHPNGRTLSEVMGSGDPVFVAECCLLEEVEALEDRVLNASLQVKGWQAPVKVLDDETIHLIPRSTPKRSRFEQWPPDLIRSRLLGLERHLERRYLLPPLNTEVHLDVVQETDSLLTGDSNRVLGDATDPETGSESGFGVGPGSESTNTSLRESENGITTHHQPQIRRVITRPSATSELNSTPIACATNTSSLTNPLPMGCHSMDMQDATHYLLSNYSSDQLPPGLIEWRHKLHRSTDISSMRACMEQLVAAIAWEKSIMKVLCQICRRDNNEAQLLLCDGCDHGYHTYCFRPPLIHIPPGDWFCNDCVSRATGQQVCFVCGLIKSHLIVTCGSSSSLIMGSEPSFSNRLLTCEHCSRAVHPQCSRPPLTRIPRRWICANCVSNVASTGVKASKHSSADTATSSSSNPSNRLPRKPDGTSEVESTAPNVSNKNKKSKQSASLSDTVNLKTSRPVSDAKKAEESSTKSVIRTGNIAKHLAKARPLGSGGLFNKLKQQNKNRTRLTQSRSSSNQNSDKSRPSCVQLSNPNRDKPNHKQSDRSGLLKSTEDEFPGLSGSRLNDGDNSVGTSLHHFCQDSLSGSEEDRCNRRRLTECEASWCRMATEDLINHKDSWAFRKPVNLKQVPFYRKIIKYPMDLSTIHRKSRHPSTYSTVDEWRRDVRLIFDNCEIFNEDESEVGRAGHVMRAYFESHWSNAPTTSNATTLESNDPGNCSQVMPTVSTEYNESSPTQFASDSPSDIILTTRCCQKSSESNSKTHCDTEVIRETPIEMDDCDHTTDVPMDGNSELVLDRSSPAHSTYSDSRSSGFSGFEQNEYMLGLQLDDLHSPVMGTNDPDVILPCTSSSSSSSVVHPPVAVMPSDVCLPTTSQLK